MKENLTELVFILDRSGSMHNLEEETIVGFNSLVDKQRKNSTETLLTVILFDNEYKVLYNRENVNQIRPLTNKEYFARGSTALLDAIGKTIDGVGKTLLYTSEEDRPSKILFVIMTDGKENASCLYTSEQIREKITHQKEKYSWEFLFLGANIDTVTTAGQIGISADRAAQYSCDVRGIRNCFNEALVLAVDEFRDDKEISTSWKKILESDIERKNAMDRIENRRKKRLWMKD